MKTRIATILFLLGLFLSTAAFAVEPVPANNQVQKEIKKLVQKRLSYPQFAIDSKTECTVYLKIIVGENGSLEVDCANCYCPKMKDFVVKNVEKIESSKLAGAEGSEMLLKVKFDLL